MENQIDMNNEQVLNDEHSILTLSNYFLHRKKKNAREKLSGVRRKMKGAATWLLAVHAVFPHLLLMNSEGNRFLPKGD